VLHAFEGMPAPTGPVAWQLDLKTTVAVFFRCSTRSTQHTGRTSCIAISSPRTSSWRAVDRRRGPREAPRFRHRQGLPRAAGPQTGTGIIFGTPDYLSPEQALGEQMIAGRSISSRSHVLFELLPERPLESSNAVATAYRIVHSPPPTCAAVGVEVDPLVSEGARHRARKDKTER